ncbi:LAMI_0E11848g1_1 [Lachancea mirantina]|uniref:LAMI_0E11848g1_1 n=1 Tax=Lachancea mirantina TaxID=1230905 RepID=A0A1G4JQ53_9SACH|nr:LAMI_0E11848g1_1 [Lachancea mirantina]
MKEQIQSYLKSRVTTLIPRKPSLAELRRGANPIPALRVINYKQWLFILSAFATFTWEAFDFFTVSLNVKKLSHDFGVPAKQISWGMTIVLMLRIVGAVLFGYIGDRYGRKISFLINLTLMMVLEIITGFIKTNFKQFLAARAIFGIVLGGIFGNSAAQCFDDCPAEAHSFISGFFQQGYTLGYLLAVIFTRALADTTKQAWRSCFWFASGITFCLIVFRALLPETDAFIRSQKEKAENNDNSTIKDIAVAFKRHWNMVIYMVLVMVGFNYLSHGTQDLFPTMLTNQLGFSSNSSTVTNCLANIGAIFGGLTIPHLARVTSRRFVIIVCSLCAACLIYPWGFVHNNSINASVFFMQMFIQGAWGLVPSYLHALAPDHKTKAFYVGISYQLGNLASSASSTIESSLSEKYPLYDENTGQTVMDYGKVMSILVGAVIGYLVLVVFLGTEGRSLTDGVGETCDANNEEKLESGSLSDSGYGMKEEGVVLQLSHQDNSSEETTV